MLKVSFFKRLTFKQIKKAENLNIKFISKHKESPVTLGFELYQYLSANMTMKFSEIENILGVPLVKGGHINMIRFGIKKGR